MGNNGSTSNPGSPSGAGMKAARALKVPPVAFFDQAVAEKLAVEYPDDAATLEEHAAGIFSTANMRVELVDLDHVDKLFVSGHKFDGPGADLVKGMRGIRLTASMGRKTKLTLALRCIPACIPFGAPQRVALLLHGVEEDRSMTLWSKFWGPLLIAGFHIVCVDFPGFGRSCGEDGQLKTWEDLDGEVISRIATCLKFPPGGVSVLAEGLGGRAFLRAYAQNPKPFAAHHVLLNVEMDDGPPAGVGQQLDSRGADVFCGVCESFWSGQAATWPAQNSAALMSLVYDASGLGRRGEWVLWKAAADPDPEADANVPKRNRWGGIVQQEPVGPKPLGTCPLPTARDMDWWTGRPQQVSGHTRTSQAMVFNPSPACLEELVGYLSAPPRETPPKGSELTPLLRKQVVESIRAFVRIRPTPKAKRFTSHDVKRPGEGEQAAAAADGQKKPETECEPPLQRIIVEDPSGDTTKPSFVVDGVLHEDSLLPRERVTQEDVYKRTAKNLVEQVLKGGNASFFAYGRASTGKTHSLLGFSIDPGIIPRCVNDFLKAIPEGTCLWYEYVQYYRGGFYDLLAKSSIRPADIDTNSDGATFLRSIQRFKLEAGAEAQEEFATILKDATARRERRSHAVLAFRLVKEKASPQEGAPPTLYLVDLAACDQLASNGMPEQGFLEEHSVHHSLSSLAKVLTALLDAQNNDEAEIPHEASPFTKALRDGLRVKRCETTTLACIVHAKESFEHSLRTVEFASRVTHASYKALLKPRPARRPVQG